MIYIYWISIIALIINQKISLFNKIAYMFASGVLMLIAIFHVNDSDYLAYINIYQRILDNFDIVSFREEVGFLLVLKGLSFVFDEYFGAAAAIYFISISITCWFIYRYSTNPCLSLVLYAFYPFFYDIVQIRNLLGFSLILLAIHFMFTNKRNIAWLLSLAAIFVHIGMIIYVAIILLYFFRNRPLLKGSLLALTIMGFLLAINLESRLESYYYHELRYGWIIGIVSYVLLLLALYAHNKGNSYNDDLYKFTLYALLCCSIVLPSYYFSLAGARIIRNLSLLVFINVADIKLTCNMKWRDALAIVCLFLYIAISLSTGNYVEERTIILDHIEL